MTDDSKRKASDGSAPESDDSAFSSPPSTAKGASPARERSQPRQAAVVAQQAITVTAAEVSRVQADGSGLTPEPPSTNKVALALKDCVSIVESREEYRFIACNALSPIHRQQAMTLLVRNFDKDVELNNVWQALAPDQIKTIKRQLLDHLTTAAKKELTALKNNSAIQENIKDLIHERMARTHCQFLHSPAHVALGTLIDATKGAHTVSACRLSSLLARRLQSPKTRIPSRS
jgi:hypothetical protein